VRPKCHPDAVRQQVAFWTRLVGAGVVGLLMFVVTRTHANEIDLAPAATKRVLILFSDERLLPANIVIDEAIRQVLNASKTRVELFSEYFDLARFPGTDIQQQQREFFRAKYRERQPDLVIAVSDAALAFAAGPAGRLFPAVPIVFCVVSDARRREILSSASAHDVAGFTVADTALPTLDLIRRLHPDAQHLAVVAGSSVRDQVVTEAVRSELAVLPAGWEVSWLSHRSIDGLRDELSRLPDQTIVLYLTMFQDAAGDVFTPRQALEAFAPASRVPIYGFYDTYVGHGIVGGPMVTFEETGRKAGQMGLRILAGEDPQKVDESGSIARVPIFDGRELDRWNIRDRMLPTGSVVRFRQVSYWEEHPWIVASWISLTLLEALLIALLLVQLRRRRLAEALQRESEQRMSLATDAAHLGLWIRDLERGEIWANDTWRRLFDFAPSERLELERVLEKVHRDDRSALRRTLETAVVGASRYDFEFRLTQPDGTTRWISAQGHVQFDAKNRPVLMRGVCSDCSARKQTEQEALLLRQEIAHFGRVSMMGQLASALAHEINQPLGAILRNAEAAEMFMQSASPDLEEVRAILADIRSDNGRATTVIGRMRTLLRRNELDVQPLDVNELVRDVAALVRSDARARRVSLDVDVSSDLPHACGDRAHLQQVLLNLIINAMDALNAVEETDRRVSVTARLDRSNVVEVAVSDTGPGVPAAIRGNLFDPFFTTKPNGMGMGLAISNTIITAHDGRLWVEPNDGTGATFRFTLPVAEVASM
jgi:PAS domain S-box-containing protein